MKVTSLVNSNQVNENCTVLINLSGAGGPNGRITVNESLTLKELGVNPNAVEVAKPRFPAKEIDDINRSDHDEVSKAEFIKKIIEGYQKVASAFAAAGGETLEDRIIHATVDWLVANKGFSREDNENSPVISEEELQVTAVPLADGGILFSVVGTAVWGDI
jgi:hypothetical protein